MRDNGDGPQQPDRGEVDAIVTALSPCAPAVAAHLGDSTRGQGGHAIEHPPTEVEFGQTSGVSHWADQASIGRPVRLEWVECDVPFGSPADETSSRFGYLGPDIPPDATTAKQAEAFAALLDALGIAQTDVVSISAGTTSVPNSFGAAHPIARTKLVGGLRSGSCIGADCRLSGWMVRSDADRR